MPTWLKSFVEFGCFVDPMARGSRWRANMVWEIVRCTSQKHSGVKMSSQK